MTPGPEPLTFPERRHIQELAHKAKKVWPGPVGLLVSRQLADWADFGYRFGGHSDALELISTVDAASLPGEEETHL